MQKLEYLTYIHAQVNCSEHKQNAHEYLCFTSISDISPLITNNGERTDKRNVNILLPCLKALLQQIIERM